MTSISDKIDKWFIDTKIEDLPIPQTRHRWKPTGSSGGSGSLEQSNVRHCAHATVDHVVEGKNYQKKWYDAMDSIAGSSKPDECTVYHAAWKLNDVHILGADANKSGDTPMELVNAVDDNGVSDMFIAVSGHAGGGRGSTPNNEFVNNSGIERVALDTRHPSAGSFHQKFSVFSSPTLEYGLVGSVDIDKGRWGRRKHKKGDKQRPKEWSTSSLEWVRKDPTHDVGVKIQGDALSDLAWAFVERWNDDSRDNPVGHLENADGNSPPTIDDTPSDRTAKQGKQRVQVLLTYGNSSHYSWGENGEGEFTAWASCLNAIKTANDYIYIEDQYFSPLGEGWGSIWYDRSGLRQFCPIYQLKKAIEDDVTVIAVTNRETNSKLIDNKREYGIEQLRSVASNASGEFHAAYLENSSGQDIYVHSKLMLCDDEFTYVGSANMNSRSLTTDGELQVGIVDENDQFTTDYRERLWNEHTGKTMGAGLSSDLNKTKSAIQNGSGRIRSYPTIDTTFNWPAWPGKGQVAEVYDGPDQKILKIQGGVQ